MRHTIGDRFRGKYDDSAGPSGGQAVSLAKAIERAETYLRRPLRGGKK